MIVRYRCPDGAIRRRPCEVEAGRPCRCKGGPLLVVDLDGDERALSARPPRPSLPAEEGDG